MSDMSPDEQQRFLNWLRAQLARQNRRLADFEKNLSPEERKQFFEEWVRLGKP
jgi:hypothetical protein